MLSCAEHKLKLPNSQSVWNALRDEAEIASREDAVLEQFFEQSILAHDNLQTMIAGRVAARLWTRELDEPTLNQIFIDQLNKMPDFLDTVTADILAVYYRDPACHRYMEVVLYLKGFLAIQAHRFSHSLWASGRKDLGYFLQGRSSSVFQTDIHPAARFGRGIFLDHATGFVVGETAVIDDNVSILHDVTLGGTGKECADRHPKIKHGVLIGAGAKILGNIIIGECSKIAAGSVVLSPVPANATVAGVPARIIGQTDNGEPALSMDQFIVNVEK